MPAGKGVAELKLLGEMSPRVGLRQARIQLRVKRRGAL